MPDARRLTVVVTLTVLAGTLPPNAFAQLSPGPLSRAHEDLEGVTKCLKCHGIGSAALDDRCLACHETIGWLREEGRGLHGTEKGKQCVECHGEHGGRDFEVVHWTSGGPEEFDHRRAGWPLRGKHATVECRKCHRPDLQATPFPAAAGWKSTRGTWLGLEAQCRACHADPHQGRLGPRCASCHDETDFHRITEQRFDHEVTRYPLRGAHVDVQCEKCHERVDEKLTMPRFGRCDDCHADPHAGQARVAGTKQPDCDACHALRYFRPSLLGLQFHASTKFPLEGKHARLDCEKCHRNRKKSFGTAAVEFRPAGSRCSDCHEDAHRGQLTGRKDGGACDACHVVSGFSPATFTVADHDGAAFPLRQRHREIACARCHGPDRSGLPALGGVAELGPARVALTPLEKECASCHRDPHGGRFSAGGEQPVEGGCRSCHDERDFLRVDLDAARHAQLGFRLEGAHGAVPCFDCHREMTRRPSSSSLVLLAPGSLDLPFTAPGRCVECHEDVHGGQFTGRKGGDGCGVCHGAEGFRPAVRFDHDRDASFRLVGAHERVACAGCHPTGAAPDGREATRYTPVPKRCEDCHATPPRPLEGS